MARSAREYTEVLGGPLPPRRLLAIQQSLPEHERLKFLHSLDERIADELMAATAATTTLQRAALTSATGAVAPDQHAR